MSEFSPLVYLAPDVVPYILLFVGNIYEMNAWTSGSTPLSQSREESRDRVLPTFSQIQHIQASLLRYCL